MKISEFIKTYRRKDSRHNKATEKIQNEINLLEETIAALSEKRRHLKRPFWIEEIILPIAKELTKFFPNREYEIFGPFGLCCETSIHFYKKGVNEKNKHLRNNCLSITFTPRELMSGSASLSIRDYSKREEKFAKGTIEDINGMNFVTTEIIDSTDIKELVKFVR